MIFIYSAVQWPFLLLNGQVGATVRTKGSRVPRWRRLLGSRRGFGLQDEPLCPHFNPREIRQPLTCCILWRLQAFGSLPARKRTDFELFWSFGRLNATFTYSLRRNWYTVTKQPLRNRNATLIPGNYKAWSRCFTNGSRRDATMSRMESVCAWVRSLHPPGITRNNRTYKQIRAGRSRADRRRNWVIRKQYALNTDTRPAPSARFCGKFHVVAVFWCAFWDFKIAFSGTYVINYIENTENLES